MPLCHLHKQMRPLLRRFSLSVWLLLMPGDTGLTKKRETVLWQSVENKLKSFTAGEKKLLCSLLITQHYFLVLATHLYLAFGLSL